MYNSTDISLWLAALANFKKKFSMAKIENKSGPAYRQYAEIYVYNKFTIQFRSMGENSFDGIIVEVYFDSELLDYKNKTLKFKYEELSLAIDAAKNIYQENTNCVVVDALSDSD